VLLLTTDERLAKLGIPVGDAVVPLRAWTRKIHAFTAPASKSAGKLAQRLWTPLVCQPA